MRQAARRRGEDAMASPEKAAKNQGDGKANQIRGKERGGGRRGWIEP
jgi:hypothetical protein